MGGFPAGCILPCIRADSVSSAESISFPVSNFQFRHCDIAEICTDIKTIKSKSNLFATKENVKRQHLNRSETRQEQKDIKLQVTCLNAPNVIQTTFMGSGMCEFNIIQRGK